MKSRESECLAPNDTASERQGGLEPGSHCVTLPRRNDWVLETDNLVLAKYAAEIYQSGWKCFNKGAVGEAHFGKLTAKGCEFCNMSSGNVSWMVSCFVDAAMVGFRILPI